MLIGTIKFAKNYEIKVNDTTIHHQYFLPTKPHDVIHYYYKKQGTKYYLSERPFVEIPSTSSLLIIKIKNWISCNDTVARQILTFNFETLCIMAENGDIASLTDIISSANCNKLLSAWHKEYNLRPLYLLGLTNKDIKHAKSNLNMTCRELYEQCLSNPFIVYNISNK